MRKGSDLDINQLSKTYLVRRILEDDLEDLLELCSDNPLYYEYCPPFVTKESLREELTALPPGKSLKDKYFIGFYRDSALIAVMDLIDGYPEPSIAYIGFFMLCKDKQGKGIASRIIGDVCDYLASADFTSLRLAWVKGNLPAELFWTGNRFTILKVTTSSAASSVILAERLLGESRKET